MPAVTKLYRFSMHSMEWGVQCDEFEVLKETPKGYWIDTPFELKRKRWVSKTGFKRYAYTTKDPAADSFIARRKKQIFLLEGRLVFAKASLEFFEANKDKIINGEPVKLLTHDTHI